MQIKDLTSGLYLKPAFAANQDNGAAKANATAEVSPNSAPEQARSLDVLRQELRAALDLRFTAKSVPNAFQSSAYNLPATAGGIQAETLGRARGLANAEPGQASRIVVRFRAQVSETASLLSNTLSGRADVGRIGDVAGGIDSALQALGSEFASNRVASTEVLSVDSKYRASANIRIKTQEGDIVRIKLANTTKLDAEQGFATNESGSLSTTEIDFRERSSLRLVIQGDLNDDELAAIENVFDQAAEIADEFFGGDIADALAVADSFEFDTDELKKVSLNFREFESQTVRYARETVTPPQPSAPVFQPVSPDSFAPIINRPIAPQPTAVPASKPSIGEVVTPTFERDTVQAPVQSDTSETVDDGDSTTVGPDSIESAAPTSSARDQLFRLISDFLSNSQSAFAGFEDGEQRQFFLSQTFRLKILSETIRVQAPTELEDTADAIADAVAGAASPDVEPKSAVA
ncbi:MAG: hypothetical protein AAF265_04170 [Pseudomonadota bacterium]